MVFTKVPCTETQMSSFPNFSLFAGCSAGTYYVGRALCSLLQHLTSQVINPPRSLNPSLPVKLLHRLPLRYLTSITLDDNIVVFVFLHSLRYIRQTGWNRKTLELREEGEGRRRERVGGISALIDQQEWKSKACFSLGKKTTQSSRPMTVSRRNV